MLIHLFWGIDKAGIGPAGPRCGASTWAATAESLESIGLSGTELRPSSFGDRVPIQQYVAGRTLQYAGHASRMGPERLPYSMLFAWSAAPRMSGAQEVSLGSTIRAHLRWFGLPGEDREWLKLAGDRKRWREAIGSSRRLLPVQVIVLMGPG